MAKPKKTEVMKGWRIQLLSPNGWVQVNELPIHKTKAKNAARRWKSMPKMKVRIAKVQVTTELFAIEQV